MSSPFDRPAPPGDQFSCETHVGALLVIDVLEHVPPMQTRVSDKPQDAIRANVYVISPAGTVAEEFRNTLLFPRMLVSRLQQSLGRKVLGVLTGQPNVKRDGKNVPYDLDDPSDAMEAAAVQAMAQHSAKQMQSAPAAPSWGQQPATPAAGPWGTSTAGQPQGAPWGGQPAAQQGPPPGWGQQQPGGWQQPPAPQGPPPGWGQQQLPPAQEPQQGPWGPPPAEQAPAWPPAQPAAQGDRPPWEQEPAPAGPPPWGGGQQ